jgi:hypothetical protein
VAIVKHIISEPTINTILLMEAFFRSLRSDLGISNFGLKNGDFGHFMLQHGALFAEMAIKNPNMTLRELSDLEEKFELHSSVPTNPPTVSSTT